jgi:hypothetical protein
MVFILITSLDASWTAFFFLLLLYELENQDPFFEESMQNNKEYLHTKIKSSCIYVVGYN